jgi:hypothetical protein
MLRAKVMKVAFPLLAVLFFASAGFSQDQPVSHSSVDLTPKPRSAEPISYYHLEFTVKILDSGKLVSSRTFTMDANTDTNYRGSYRSDVGGKAPDNKRDQTNLDCNQVHVVGANSVSMQLTVFANSPLDPNTSYTSDSGTFYPLIVLGKPNLVFSADEPTPNRKIQLEVTATPIHIN